LRGNFLPCEAEEEGGLAPADDENAAGRKRTRKDVNLFYRRTVLGPFPVGKNFCRTWRVLLVWPAKIVAYQGSVSKSRTAKNELYFESGNSKI